MSLFNNGCECASTLVGTGALSCMPEVTRDSYKIYCHYYGSDGAINSVPKGTVINEAYIVAKLEAVDYRDRWYITPKIENQAAPVPEMESESIGNQTYMTGEEIKQAETFEHVKSLANPALLAFYQGAGCAELGEFTVTRSGQMTGMNDGSGNLIPVRLQDDSLQATYSKPIQGQTQRVMVSRTSAELENDANLDFIDTAQITYSALLWYSKAPIEVIPYDVIASTATLVFKLQSMFGGVNAKSPILGIVTADMASTLDAATGELYNVTTAANVAGTLTYNAVTELYTFTYGVATTLADVIDFAITKTGYHFGTRQVTTA